MALVIMCMGEDPEKWKSILLTLEPSLDIRVWPEVGNVHEIFFALVWEHPKGELKNYPNLRCVASMGAGVDHIMSDPELPQGVFVTRVVHESLTLSMKEYVIHAVLDQCRDMEKYRQDQRNRRWDPKFPSPRAEVGVGVMGLGKLGGPVAATLREMGYKVLGWSRTPKKLEGIETFWGMNQLPEFLSRTDILICLLPLTAETEGILNLETFRKLRPGAFLINVARGRHLVEEDLISALDQGILRGARLDVFRVEPLPQDHPFWSHPKIQITPHISSLTEPEAVAPQILENYRRIVMGLDPINQVDLRRGY